MDDSQLSHNDEISSDEQENTSNASQSAPKQTSDCKVPILQQKIKSKKRSKLQYKLSCMYKEDHNKGLYSVQFNRLVNYINVFACVGTNRVTIYECLNNGKLSMLQCYADDPDVQENFYTCAWSYNDCNYKPILAVAGQRGVIRILSTSSQSCIRSFTGHGQAINELKFHPRDCNLLLSVSKDYTLRLWNIKTDVCVVIFGGVEGHRDEVLSADFDFNGNRIVSSGMDHSLKIWRLDVEEIRSVIQKSYEFVASSSMRSFPTHREHFPDFSTRDVHCNYVDCVSWFGDFIISKSCDNCLIFWKPGQSEDILHVHELKLEECEIWFLKFAMDSSQKILALGNQIGKVYILDIDINDPNQIRSTILSHEKCNAAVRQTSFNQDGSILLSVCDDGTIWRWDRIPL